MVISTRRKETTPNYSKEFQRWSLGLAHPWHSLGQGEYWGPHFPVNLFPRSSSSQNKCIWNRELGRGKLEWSQIQS